MVEKKESQRWLGTFGPFEIRLVCWKQKIQSKSLERLTVNMHKRPISCLVFSCYFRYMYCHNFKLNSVKLRRPNWNMATSVGESEINVGNTFSTNQFIHNYFKMHRQRVHKKDLPRNVFIPCWFISIHCCWLVFFFRNLFFIFKSSLW